MPDKVLKKVKLGVSTSQISTKVSVSEEPKIEMKIADTPEIKVQVDELESSTLLIPKDMSAIGPYYQPHIDEYGELTWTNNGGLENPDPFQFPTIEEIYDKHYVHKQLSASDHWVIYHRMHKYPSVSIVDSGENEVIGDVHYIDENTLEVNFSGVFSGKAYLN